jgi:hypothetical protein
MYNFRFDSNRPPQTANATIGFFKTGQPITIPVQVPSAAPSVTVAVSGRVTNAQGRGVYGARVTITDSNNNARMVTTNPFGYYRFDNVASGGMYTLRARDDNLTDVNFVALQ